MTTEGYEISRIKLVWALPVFILLVVAVVSWQWIDDSSSTTQAESPLLSTAVSQSDYYLEDFEIINISITSNDTGGNKSSAGRRLKLTGRTLSHHHLEGYSTLENPVVQLQNENDDYWMATARRGNVSAEFDVLDLEGAVKLTNNSPADVNNDDSIKIDTESLTIDTSQRTVETDVEVRVLGNGWQYTANSMSALIDDGRLSFQSGVEATFESPNR